MLLDGVIEEWEAIVTLASFSVFIMMCYVADCLRRKSIQAREDALYGQIEKVEEGAERSKGKVDLSAIKSLSVVDFYNKLVPLEAGQAVLKQDEQITTQMKEFLLLEFGTTKVSEVDKEALKLRLEGPALIERINHRKAVAVNYRKEAISKYEVIRRENKSANTLKEN